MPDSMSTWGPTSVEIGAISAINCRWLKFHCWKRPFRLLAFDVTTTCVTNEPINSSRPYLGEIDFIARTLDAYSVPVGFTKNERLNTLYMDSLCEKDGLQKINLIMKGWFTGCLYDECFNKNPLRDCLDTILFSALIVYELLVTFMPGPNHSFCSHLWLSS